MAIRKFHETKRNLKFEQRLADIFAEHWSMEERKLPQNHTLDRVYLKDDGKTIDRYAECRYRECIFGQYPDVFLGMTKVRYAESIRPLGLRTYFLVGFKCGTVAWTEVIDPSAFVWAGRSEDTARNDEDIEPVSLFNNEKFEVIREGKGSFIKT